MAEVVDDDASTTRPGGPPAIDPASGSDNPTAADGRLLSATGRTGGPSTSGFAPATSLGDGHLVTNTGTTLPAPGFAGGPPAANGGHHAANSSYPPSLDLLEVLDVKGNKFVLRMNSETSV